MREIPTVAFAGWSGAGKTTLIERLVQRLKASGLRVAVIKRDAHRFEIDRKGKDSWRFSQAGADITVLSSREKTALVERGELTFAQTAALIRDVDLVLVEGYKQEPLTQIGICRRASGKGFPDTLDHYVALVTDMEVGNVDVPCFGLDDISGVTEFLLGNLEHFSCIRCRD